MIKENGLKEKILKLEFNYIHTNKNILELHNLWRLKRNLKILIFLEWMKVLSLAVYCNLKLFKFLSFSCGDSFLVLRDLALAFYLYYYF